MKTATKIKDGLPRFIGHAVLYRLSEPVTYEETLTTDHVVVSAAHGMLTGPETYIFPADADGKILNWGELDGSYRGGLDHASALESAGFQIVE